jgi:N-methylhydantoinase B/oxoprolinase/acetone carboxylase alpha subunit
MAGRSGSLTLGTQDGSPIEVPQFGVRSLQPTRIVIASPGGGGFRDPMRRDPKSVLRDVADGVVSPAKAHEVYATVLTGAPLRVDATATAALDLVQFRLPWYSI